MTHTKTLIKRLLLAPLGALLLVFAISVPAAALDSPLSHGNAPVHYLAADSGAGKQTCSTSSCPLIQKYINPTIAMLTAAVGVAAVIGIIYGGIEITTSAGDPQKNASGKNHIRNAVIGIVSLVFLWAFLNWIVPGGVAP